jgi:hypothetical protein
MLGSYQPCESAGLGRRGYYRGTHARSSRWIDAF